MPPPLTVHYVFMSSNVHPSVRFLSIHSALLSPISQAAISLNSGGISMKLATNIHHVSAETVLSFRGQRSRS